MRQEPSLHSEMTKQRERGGKDRKEEKERDKGREEERGEEKRETEGGEGRGERKRRGRRRKRWEEVRTEKKTIK